jgi:hypothetical protein
MVLNSKIHALAKNYCSVQVVQFINTTLLIFSFYAFLLIATGVAMVDRFLPVSLIAS